MRYRTLGNSGCAVSELCLGTMTFGAETDEEGARAQLDRFVEAGGTLVDTADVYSAGVSEEIIGRWLADRPADVTERVVLATKGRFPIGRRPERRRLVRPAPDPRAGRLAGAGSAWTPSTSTRCTPATRWTPLEETLRTLDGFVRAGQDPLLRLVQLHRLAADQGGAPGPRLGLAAPVTLQPQYSLIVREIEWEIVPAALDAGLGLLPWSPLGGGWLTGKYRRDQRPTGDTRLGDDPGRGMEAWERRGTERTWEIIDAVQSVAEARGALDGGRWPWPG